MGIRYNSLTHSLTLLFLLVFSSGNLRADAPRAIPNPLGSLDTMEEELRSNCCLLRNIFDNTIEIENEVTELLGRTCDSIPLTLDGNVTTVISQPGYYRVMNSPTRTITGITGTTPAAPFVQIIITSSDVTLDLCGNVLTGSGNQTKPFSPAPTVVGGIQNDSRVDSVVGIQINPTGSVNNILDNITITNGKMQYYSISAIQGNFVDNITIKNMIIENSASVTEPATRAVFLRECSNITYSHNNHVKNRFTDVTIANQIRRGQNAVVTNHMSKELRGSTTSSANFNPDWLAIQSYVDFGLSCLGSIHSVSNAAAGGTDNVVIRDAEVTDVKAGALLFGIFVQVRGNNVTIQNCNVTDVAQVLSDLTVFNPGGFGPLPAPNYEVRGIAVENVSLTHLIENCMVSSLSMALTKVTRASGTGIANSCVAYNFHRSGSKIIRNCIADHIRSSGRITSLVPELGQLTADNITAGFIIEMADGTRQSYEFDGCHASNIDGGTNAAAGPSSGYGFLVVDPGFRIIPEPLISCAAVFRNCVAQETTGASTSAGFCITAREQYPDTLLPWTPMVFENCIAQHDRIRNQSLSHGFRTTVRNNNVVFRGCIAEGHILNGFELFGYRADNATGNAKFILDNCISNGNNGYGFRLDQSLKQVEVINCKATNNNLDGFNAAGRDLVFRSDVADLNLDEGFFFEQYFPFFAKVATDVTNVSVPGPGATITNLGVYGGAYTVEYVQGPVAGPKFNQYFNIIPNNPAAATPANLTINGVTVNNGDIVLIKDLSGADSEVGGARNGVYIASNIGGVTPTTIAAASNGQSLPQATINVASTDGFPSSGALNVTTSTGIQTVNYTGKTATSFTGATGGTGVMSTGGLVWAAITNPFWQLTRVDPWRAPGVIPSGTKILVAQSNAPNTIPAPIMYTLNVNVTVDTTVITNANFIPTTAIVPDPSRIIVDDCRAADNTNNGFHNRARDVVIRKSHADRNGGVGFLDDTANGAQANLNLYARNRAFNNANGAGFASNYTVDYLTPANPTIFQTAIFPDGPVGPTGVVAPEANLSITLS